MTQTNSEYLILSTQLKARIRSQAYQLPPKFNFLLHRLKSKHSYSGVFDDFLRLDSKPRNESERGVYTTRRYSASLVFHSSETEQHRKNEKCSGIEQEFVSVEKPFLLFVFEPGCKNVSPAFE